MTKTKKAAGQGACVTRTVEAGGVRIGEGEPIVLIAGPCVIESASSAARHARRLKEIAGRAGVPFIFKSSYDKANRSSIRSFRGPGIKKGLAILRRVKEEVGVPVTSDVHCTSEIGEAGKVLDIIQIPAFLSRQTDLLVAAARTGKPVNIKKGQFLAPWDMEHAVRKVVSAGNRRVLLTERGVTFGYNTLVTDFRSIPIMKRFGCPVLYDATHSVQKPGGLGDRSGGEREFVPYLALAACVCGADGIFIEAHEDPDRAPSDGPNMMTLDGLERLLDRIKGVERVVRDR